MLRHKGKIISRLGQFATRNTKDKYYFIFILAIFFIFTNNFIKKNDEDHKLLKVITKISPNTYIDGDEGPNGFEYALLEKFSNYINHDLEIIITDSLADLSIQLHKNKADFASAALSKKTITSNRLLSSDPYLLDQTFLIYNVNQPRPKNIKDLIGKKIVVISNSHHSLYLQAAKKNHPDLHWKEQENIDYVELLNKIKKIDIDYTLIDKKEFILHQGFFPKIKMAFEVGNTSSLAWAFTENNKFFEKANSFIKTIKANGELEKLEEQYYGQAIDLKQHDANEFDKKIKTTLPKLIQKFKLIADKYDISWQLLAAISYQESRWNPLAKSRTGVRGLMMLTLPTAKEVGVTNRLDPLQSLEGGAKYFLKLKKRIPKHIGEPDRTWFALAAYNVGLGHLEDARIITESRGGDPNSWYAIKQSLPLLTQKKWYLNTKYGYARGYEPVQYVQNIRQYYNVLNSKLYSNKSKEYYQ